MDALKANGTLNRLWRLRTRDELIAWNLDILLLPIRLIATIARIVNIVPHVTQIAPAECTRSGRHRNTGEDAAAQLRVEAAEIFKSHSYQPLSHARVPEVHVELVDEL